MLNNSEKELNKRILRNLLAEKEYCLVKGNLSRLEELELAILWHKKMIFSEYEKED